MTPFESLRNSNLAIRWSLAIVFIWFGVDKLVDPGYWLNAWHSKALNSLIASVGLDGGDFVTAVAILEVLVGVSLITGLFIKWFALLGLIMLCLSFMIFGLSEIMIRNIGLIGGFTAILFWPSRRSI